jgi:tetratricopeptide (TPR) repeat protein
MSAFTPCLVVVSVIGVVLPICQSDAQPLECGVDDQQCLDDSLFLACGQPESDEASCLAWVQAVQAHPLSGNPNWRLTAAAGYSHVSSLSGSREDSERYREQGRVIYRDALAEWPDGSYARQAYVGLASLSDDISQSISLLRDARRADPSNENTPYFLAMALQARGREGDYGEAADLYRRTYSAWSGYYSAATALRLYSVSGQEERAADFRDEVARDSGMIDFAEEVVSPAFARNLGRAATVLETACQPDIIDIFGSETCASGIDTLVAATRLTNYLPERQSIADVATEGMRMLTVSGAGTPEERAERENRFGSILQEFIDTEAATAATYVLWAQHGESDLDESVSAFERAVELAPDNGRYRYWLAQGYIEQGRFDEAIENLTVARDILPANLGITPESVDREMRRAESARNLR